MANKIITKEEAQNRSYLVHNNKFIIYSINRIEYGSYGKKGTYLDLKCKVCNHRNLVKSYNHLNEKTGCVSCSGKSKWTLEKVRTKSKEIHNDKFIIHNIQIKNIGNKTASYIDSECKICKNRSIVDVGAHINQRIGCGGACKRGGSRESYIEFLKNNSSQANRICTLYFLKFTHKITNEEFYKVGITFKKISERFRDRLYKKYIIEECQVIKTTNLKAVLEEDDFLGKFSKYKYLPEVRFKGWTECFSKEIVNEFK
jgi:hypothetical protein